MLGLKGADPTGPKWFEVNETVVDLDLGNMISLASWGIKHTDYAFSAFYSMDTLLQGVRGESFMKKFPFTIYKA